MGSRLVKSAPEPPHECDLPRAKAVISWVKSKCYTLNPVGEIVQCEECLTYWISEHEGYGFYANYNYWRRMNRFEVWRKKIKC